MSSFASKRKARVIKVDDEEDGASTNPPTTAQGPSKGDAAPSATSHVNFTRKPFRQSGLRKSTNIDQDDDTPQAGTTVAAATGAKPAAAQDYAEQDDGPVVIRPSINRSGSSKQKKRASSSRLSFGRPGQAADGDDSGSHHATPKKSTSSLLGQQAAGNSATRKSKFAVSTSGPKLPLRRFNDEDDDDDRPRYSKEHLDELQSSTPNRPQDLPTEADETNGKAAEDPMELDESELEGALIVDEQGRDTTGSSLSVRGRQPEATPAQTRILSATEIEERKQRRARRANEQDFISLDGGAGGDEYDDDDDAETARNRRENNDQDATDDTRLVREDEDLGEGFDEFVEDGGLSLGKKAEREAKTQRRREMAEQIRAAEGDSDEESDDSEAERRAAFEVAQTRSGMDGLNQDDGGNDHERRAAEAALQVPHKITPLPDLQGCLERLRITLRGMEAELKTKSNRVEELKDEREAIEKRETEVQGLLDDAGKKYTSVLSGGAGAATAATPAVIEAGQSPAQQIQNAGMSELAVERGLESFGTTPDRSRVAGEQEEQ